jgi:hypothetical protein
MSPIRHAIPTDANNLSALAEETFRDTFGGMNTVKNMNHHCQKSDTDVIQLDEIADPRMTTLVCEDGGNLIAFAQLRWSKPPGCVTAKNPGALFLHRGPLQHPNFKRFGRFAADLKPEAYRPASRAHYRHIVNVAGFTCIAGEAVKGCEIGLTSRAMQLSSQITEPNYVTPPGLWRH